MYPGRSGRGAKVTIVVSKIPKNDQKRTNQMFATITSRLDWDFLIEVLACSEKCDHHSHIKKNCQKFNQSKNSKLLCKSSIEKRVQNLVKHTKKSILPHNAAFETSNICIKANKSCVFHT